jgi:GT2 family glycosyltransferase
VVVNAGTFVFEKNEKVAVLFPGKNTGYLGALRYVIETKKPDFKYITLCNTDLSFGGENFLAQYTNELDKKEFAVAAPRIFSELTQTEQNPLCANRQPKLKVERQKFFYGNPFLYSIYQYLFYLKRVFSKHSPGSFKENPYALHGSFMTISKKYFESGGTLNYPVLMYGEELFLAEETLKLGLKNLLVSSLQIKHYDHATTGKYNFRQVSSMKEAMSFILKNYYNK